jgi:hypothetical protein
LGLKFVAGCFIEQQFHPKQYPAADTGATACADLQISRAVESARCGWRFHRTKGSQISSRASQNAAALLFDLGTVDIR